MFKQIKNLTLLLFVAATMFTFASCNKDNNNDDNPSSGGGGSSANYPESVSETKWSWGSQTGSEDINGYNMVIVTFSQTGNLTYVTMQRLDYSSNLYRGTYTYSSGNGTMALEDRDSHESASATFSINGNTLTLKMNGASYPLAKQ
jgi:hypothetical protein